MFRTSGSERNEADSKPLTCRLTSGRSGPPSGFVKGVFVDRSLSPRVSPKVCVDLKGLSDRVELLIACKVGVDGRRDLGRRMPELATDHEQWHAGAQHDRGGRMAKAVERDQRAPLVIHETRALARALGRAVCRAVVPSVLTSVM